MTAYVPLPDTPDARSCRELLEGAGATVRVLPARDLRETVVFVSPHGERAMVGDGRGVFGPPYADAVPQVALEGCGMFYVSLSSVAADASGARPRSDRTGPPIPGTDTHDPA